MVSRQDEDSRQDGRPGTKAIRMAERAFSRPCSTDSAPPVRGYPAAVAAQGRPGIPRREKLSGAENPPARREGFLPAFVLPHFASQAPAAGAESGPGQEKGE